MLPVHGKVNSTLGLYGSRLGPPPKYQLCPYLLVCSGQNQKRTFFLSVLFNTGHPESGSDLITQIPTPHMPGFPLVTLLEVILDQPEQGG